MQGKINAVDIDIPPLNSTVKKLVLDGTFDAADHRNSSSPRFRIRLTS